MMGSFWSTRPICNEVELPPLDCPANIKKRVYLLTTSTDPIYRAAYQEYITANDLNDILCMDALLPEMTSPELIVLRGDVYDKRYMIVSKLGANRNTSVWLAVDLNTYTTRSTPSCEYVAIKICRAEIHFSRESRREIELKDRMRKALEAANIPRTYSPIVRVFSSFSVVGIGGRHLCLVMERMRCSLQSLMNRCKQRRLPVHTVRLISRDALHALHFLHFFCGLVHTDLKPCNILVAVDEELLATGRYFDPDEGQAWKHGFPPPTVKICDLGGASELDSPKVVTAIGTVQYRAPEVLLGMHYHLNYDVWSMGCIIFEMLTGAKLFDPKPDPARNICEPEAHLAEICKVLGNLPESLRHLPQASVYFDDEGRLRRFRDQEPCPLRRLLHEVHGYTEQEAAEIEDFLRPMLDIDPMKRRQCKDRITHPWLGPVLKTQSTMRIPATSMPHAA